MNLAILIFLSYTTWFFTAIAMVLPQPGKIWATIIINDMGCNSRQRGAKKFKETQPERAHQNEPFDAYLVITGLIRSLNFFFQFSLLDI